MVQNTARLILCFFAAHVFMVSNSVSYNECEPREYAKCNRVFTEAFKNADKNDGALDTYCDGYKAKALCLASNVQCVGEVIDLIRFSVLQHVTKDIILGTCSNFTLMPLRKLVKANEKYLKDVGVLKDLDEDDFQPCAAKKNIYCTSRFAEEMKNDGNLCRAIPNFFKCFESKTMVCEDKIYKDFVVDYKAGLSKYMEFVKTFPNVMPGGC